MYCLNHPSIIYNTNKSKVKKHTLRHQETPREPRQDNKGTIRHPPEPETPTRTTRDNNWTLSNNQTITGPKQDLTDQNRKPTGENQQQDIKRQPENLTDQNRT